MMRSTFVLFAVCALLAGNAHAQGARPGAVARPAAFQRPGAVQQGEELGRVGERDRVGVGVHQEGPGPERRHLRGPLGVADGLGGSVLIACAGLVVCWIAGAVAFVSVGALATVIAIFPDIWVNIFTDNANVRAASRTYLHTAAPMYAFLGLATTCYFSSQGAAKVLGPVLAQTARLIFITIGGWWLSTHDATAQNFFVLTATSMGLLGALSCTSVILTKWGPRHRAVSKVRPALS